MATAAVVSFPHADAAFAAYVEQRARGCDSPAELQMALRDWFPHATVVARSELAGFGLRSRLWYAYRDGVAKRANTGTWWVADDVARVSFGRDAMFIEANAAAVRLAGGPLAGKPLASVRPPEQVDDPDWLWRTIEDQGAVTSIGRMRRFDGSEIEIEFHAGRATRPGMYESEWREVKVASLAERDQEDLALA